MNRIQEHIIFKSLTIMLVITLIIPSAVKFAHVFTHHNHKHEVCTGEKKAHLHTLDVDCDFYKFQLNKNFTFSSINLELVSIEEKNSIIESQYHFISKFQYLQTSLRGPPSLI